MRLLLKNVGKFKEVDLIIDGITVIGGENSTGKSTISKTLFSVIKAYQEAEEFAYIEKKEFDNLLMDLDKILWFLIRRRLPRNISKLLDNLMEDIRFLRYEDDVNIKRISNIQNNINLLLNELNKYVNTLDKYKRRHLERYIKDLRKIEEELKNDILPKKQKNLGNLENSLNFQIRKNFRGQFSNVNMKEISQITILEKNKKIFDIEVKNNKCVKFKCEEEPKIKEISYIESPLVLNKIRLFDSLKYLSPRIQRRIYIPYIEEDIVKKLRIQLNLEINDDVKNFIDEIEKVIGGKFEVEEEDIIYIENGKTFYPINVASGVKSFGIIYLLLKNGWLQDNTHMLIFDEPEVHLHPKWQLRYAEILVKLHKYFDCYILINSHSPDFIQAIRYYGNKYKVIDNIHFYFAEEKEGNSTIQLVDFELNKIFASLIEPLESMEDLPY
ncbi:MAG: hypothetical protein DSY66_03030 [Persephonella sp.]|nr:MAG: hypothetical protein DSY66_03030 [Persephonella sp.]